MTNSVTGTLGSLGHGPRNLSTAQRGIYIAIGLGIAAAGVKPRPNALLNIVALLGGCFIAWSRYDGHCAVKAARMDDGGRHQKL